MTPMQDTNLYLSSQKSGAFDRAWFLIKSQPLGIPFSKFESDLITNALYEILVGNDDVLKKGEAKRLWLEFLNHN
jgi:hypothetical protein